MTDVLKWILGVGAIIVATIPFWNHILAFIYKRFPNAAKKLKIFYHGLIFLDQLVEILLKDNKEFLEKIHVNLDDVLLKISEITDKIIEEFKEAGYSENDIEKALIKEGYSVKDGIKSAITEKVIDQLNTSPINVTINKDKIAGSIKFKF